MCILKANNVNLALPRSMVISLLKKTRKQRKTPYWREYLTTLPDSIEVFATKCIFLRSHLHHGCSQTGSIQKPCYKKADLIPRNQDSKEENDLFI